MSEADPDPLISCGRRGRPHGRDVRPVCKATTAQAGIDSETPVAAGSGLQPDSGTRVIPSPARGAAVVTAVVTGWHRDQLLGASQADPASRTVSGTYQLGQADYLQNQLRGLNRRLVGGVDLYVVDDALMHHPRLGFRHTHNPVPTTSFPSHSDVRFATHPDP